MSGKDYQLPKPHRESDLGLPFMMVRMSWGQEFKTVGHSAADVIKQRIITASVQLTSSFLCNLKSKPQTGIFLRVDLSTLMNTTKVLSHRHDKWPV